MSVEGVYQKPLLYNKFLPYEEKLNEEGRQLFEDIKKNLSIAVQKSELWPGALFWTNRLNSFLQIYGFQFTKEDHIKLIHLLYSLITIPNLESPLVRSWSLILSKLLKKWKLLTPEELQLPWRPLCNLFKEVFFGKFNQLGMTVHSNCAAHAVQVLVSQARNYFPVESTKEMLEEWQPLLCPFDLSMVEALSYMSEFLPTLLPLDAHDKTIRLWFDEMIQFWLAIRTPTPAEEFFVKLFVRLAKQSLGHLDWSPYVPQIFSRILRSFQLPVGHEEFRVSGGGKSHFSANSAASMIVSLLGGSSAALEHFKQLMLALESYYHPSNVGKQTKKLLQFLKDLSYHLISRLKRERRTKSDWFSSIPDHAKLKDSDIDTFVECLLPPLKMAMFSKVGTIDASSTYHNLALIRPEMVLPDLLNSTYTAFETLTEPHQLTATLQCVTAVSRSLLSGGYGRYPEGRKHLFALLTLALPGFDTNDFRKTLISSLLVSSLVSLVPLVDCSAAVGSTDFTMTEEERELCSQTSEFEGFVLQFMDRSFYLIESVRLEQATAVDRFVSAVGRNSHESIVGIGISGTFYTVLVQSSPEIFQVALDKLYRFATSKVFTSETAGSMCCDMCSAAAKVDPAATLKLFVPHCVQAIDLILNDNEQVDADHPDRDLVWNIQLLSQVVAGTGDGLLPFADDLIACLKKCFHLKSKTATSHVARAFRNVFTSLSSIYPRQVSSVDNDFNQPPTEHLYIRDWAVPADINTMSIPWHVPSQDELLFVDKLLSEFLQPAFDELKAFVDGKSTDRERLHVLLDFALNILVGCASYLPMWEGHQVEGCPQSSVPLERNHYCTSLSDKQPPASFRRDTLAQSIHHLTEHFLKSCEDDTKSLTKLAQISWILMVNYGSSRTELDRKWQAYTHTKRALEDKLRHKKHHIRQMIINRTHLQLELRQVERAMSILTPLHLTLIKDIVRMSLSEYAEVRIKAQNVLSSCMDTYLYAGRMILPDILPFLQSDGVSHEQFKGALHVMLLPPVMNMYVHDWAIMAKTLPAFVVADHSEKMSILVLLEKIVKEIHNKYQAFSLRFEVPSSCHAPAASLYTSLSDDEKEKGKVHTEEMNSKSLKSYDSLIQSLVDLFEQEKLQWRHSYMAMRFLKMLIRHDHPLPTSGVKLIINGLINDALAVRKMAISGLVLVLQQQKRKRLKVPVDVEKEAGESVSGQVCHGERSDIKWLCYDPDKLPATEDQWTEFTFIDKTHWGYYCWPNTLFTYDKNDKQSLQMKTSDVLSENEKVILEALTSSEFVQKLFSFLSLEESKGRDKYSIKKFTLFKYMFRNYGAVILPLFKPHLERLSVDSHESCQRCAAEVIAGLASGSKLWSYSMVKEMQDFLQPLFPKILEAVTVETLEDWGSCLTDISANRDPRRIHWLFQVVMHDPIHGQNGSFLDASRLYLLQSALAQQEWRVPSLQHQLLDYLKQHLSHSFKNVRERIGSVLSQIFLYDVTDSVSTNFNPSRKEFFSFLHPMLPSLPEVAATSSDKDQSMIKFYETVLVWIATSHFFAQEHFQLLFQLLPLVTVEEHEEILPLMKRTCAQVAHAEISVTTVKAAFSALKGALSCELWKVRVLGVQLLQIMIFENLFLFESLSEEVVEALLATLSDVQMEVRDVAAATLGGLVHCGFIKYSTKLKDIFTGLSRTTLPKNKLQDNTEYEDKLVRRHSGVLGLAALVEACPYSVPEWLPDVITEIASHNHDPAPIQGTVKKVMSEFRRTHHDSWNEHKQKFTDDQLAVLTDLLVSPSYYA